MTQTEAWALPPLLPVQVLGRQLGALLLAKQSQTLELSIGGLEEAVPVDLLQ